MRRHPTTFLAAALLAAGCVSEDANVPAVSPALAGGATLVAPGWPAGTSGALKLHVNLRNAPALAEAAVDGGGRFTYALPAPAPESLIPFTQAAGVTVSPPDARFQVVIVATTTLDGDESPTGELRIGNRLFGAALEPGDTGGELFYVDRDVTITGWAEGCSYDLRLARGWNYALVHVTSVTPLACEHTASPALPDGLAWHYVYLGP